MTTIDATTAADAVRERTLGLVAHFDDAALERTTTPLLSPLVWDREARTRRETMPLGRRRQE